MTGLPLPKPPASRDSSANMTRILDARGNAFQRNLNNNGGGRGRPDDAPPDGAGSSEASDGTHNGDALNGGEDGCLGSELRGSLTPDTETEDNADAGLCQQNDMTGQAVVCRSSVGGSWRSGASRKSSLELRKAPSHILLGSDPGMELDEEPLDEVKDVEGEGEKKWAMCSLLLQKTCLRPTMSLRNQMMLSFGTVSALTILFVMAISIVVSVSVGNNVKSTSQHNLQSWARNKASSSSMLVAEAFAPMLPTGDIQILREATRDRFAGYPDLPGYEDDLHVPFPDIESGGKNKYPIDAMPLKLDWQIVANVNSTNFAEHVQDRWPWYGNNSQLSTVTAFYRMQGACDPSITDPGHVNHYHNCTDANNDITTGGVVMPSPTNQHIFHKAKDLQPVIKSLYEYSSSAKTLGVFFANAGAGSSVMFPHEEIDYAQSYISIGCEWMRSSNPLDPSKPIGTPEMIARCHPKGESVPNREYNPMERSWCRDQALDPHHITFSGPYLDAWTEHLWLLSIGMSVYDRLTNEFIACTLIDAPLNQVTDVLDGVRISKSSQIAVAKWDENGTVVASPCWNLTEMKETITVDDPALGLGISVDGFQELKGLVDFDDVWDPREVRARYEKKNLKSDGKLISCYPIPPVPDEFDPNYRPAFMVFLSLEENDIFNSFYDLDNAVDYTVMRLVIFTVIVGLGGLGLVALLIFVVSSSLTKPLQWMRDVSNKIVDQFGDENAQGINLRQSDTFRFSPKTELNDLMVEFQKIVSQFSSDGAASKTVRFGSQLTEVKNKFVLLDEFMGLYQSREDTNFEYGYGDMGTPKANESSSEITWYSDENGVTALPRRRHFGRNIHTADTEFSPTLADNNINTENSVLKSPLFLWIVGLVVTPLLVTTITISSVVMWNVLVELAAMDAVVQDEYLQLEKNAMNLTSSLRAMQASAIMANAVRNLHVLTRAAGWLMFGALNRSDAFTEMVTAAEQCKTAKKAGACSYFDEAPCDCEWNDMLASDLCRHYGKEVDSRYLQRVFWVGQSQDAWQNGDRNFTSFPEVAMTPDTTSFWDDVRTVPGSEKGSSAMGFETTYDRLRTVAALSAIHLPLYNYDFSKDKTPGTYIGFEADGMFVGYAGCDHGYTADLAFWQSSESNGAAQLNPDLCPLGKYGIDCRCRDYYKTGKAIGMDVGPPLYVTPPYLFTSGKGITAQTCTTPLIDPITGKHIGQALVDFIPNSIFSSLFEKTQLGPGGFPLLITTHADVFGADTVVGPGFTIGDPGKAIEELVLPHDKNCTNNDCGGFYKIAKDMRAGKNGTAIFSRSRLDGSKETVHISYVPVNVKSFRPANSSNFSRGVQEYISLIYSLGIAQPENALLESFQDTKGDIEKQVEISVGVLAALVTLASALLIYTSSRLTVSITVPILDLLALTKNINRLESQDKENFSPPMEGFGSSEVLAVYDTFSMLFKVVRFANSAFFSGNIERAYRVLVDALLLFKRLENKKAIGVASNNLGNCMLTMYRIMESTNEPKICGLSKSEIVLRGTAYFREAIKLGEEAYDKFYEEVGWSGKCLVFMQHLSNRYFNCAIFLFTVKKDHKRPHEAHHLGSRDLQISSDMDVEVVDQCLEVGFNIDKVEQFDLRLSRIRGFLSLMELPYLSPHISDKWNVKELLDQTFKDLGAALKNPLSSDLFEDVSPAGRMQQLDAELTRYAMLKKDEEEAARIGIRMLIEDEYMLHNAEAKAAEALVTYSNDLYAKGNGAIKQETLDALHEYQEKMEEDFKEAVVCRASLSEKASRLSSLDKVESARDAYEGISRLSFTLRETYRGDFTMEVF